MRARFPSARGLRPFYGLSLIEILVGLSLLGGAILVVLGLFPTAYSSLIQARDTTAATNLAREVLEEARALPFGALSNVTKAPVTLTATVNGAQVATQCFYDLTFIPSSPVANLYYEATVIVRWSSGSVPGSGTNHTLRMDTVISNR